MKTALIQMRTVLDKAQNVADAVAQIAAAAGQGADLAVLPEMFCCPYQHKYFRPYSESAGGPVWQALSDAARTNHIWVVGGTFPELDGEKLYNTCFVFDREGNQVARHRKIHLFDAAVNDGPHFQESATLSPGDQLTLFDTEFGKLGVCVCFDIRFPELFLLMSKAGAQAVIVPLTGSCSCAAAPWTPSCSLWASAPPGTRRATSPTATPWSALPGAKCWLRQTMPRRCAWCRWTSPSSRTPAISSPSSPLAGTTCTS